MHTIFDYEKEMKLIPLIDESSSALLSHDMKFNDFLVEWDEMRKKHYNGEITDEEFED
ncbi:transcriptional regulator [Facklamia sp. HMSC062C11]|nr:transcriptional regulator [Facklamia sp. HMSC062C11]PKY92880.1 transcriptional regulator [Facklamia hominis]